MPASHPLLALCLHTPRSGAPPPHKAADSLGVCFDCYKAPLWLLRELCLPETELDWARLGAAVRSHALCLGFGELWRGKPAWALREMNAQQNAAWVGGWLGIEGWGCFIADRCVNAFAHVNSLRIVQEVSEPHSSLSKPHSETSPFWAVPQGEGGF